MGGGRGYVHSGVGINPAQGWPSNADAKGGTLGMGSGEGQDRAAGTKEEREGERLLREAGHAQM